MRRLVALAGDGGRHGPGVAAGPVFGVNGNIFLKAHSINFACELGCQRGGPSNSCLMLPVANWFWGLEV